MVHWRGWFASKPTEAEFVEGLIRDRSDAPTWIYDPKARTLSQSGNVLNLVNIYREFAAATGGALRAAGADDVPVTYVSLADARASAPTRHRANHGHAD